MSTLNRLVICSHLLLLCGGLLPAFSWSCPPPGPLFLACFGPCFPCPLFGFWSFPWFLSCCGSSVSFLSVCVSACCFAVVFSLAFVCRLWCCGASLFAVFVVLCLAPLPRWLLSPSPRLRLFPCGVLVQLLCWSLPLGIWLLHATARLPCPSVRRSDICGEMNPFGLFCIGRSAFGFHLDGELNRDG